MSPLSLSEGNTVRCTHDAENLKNRLGTVTYTDVPRAGRSNTHVRVAFIGHDRETVVPIDWIELVTDVTVDEMIERWSSELQRVSEHGTRNNRYYDEAPDGSQQKQDARDTMDRLSRRRTLIELALDHIIV